MGSEIEVVSSSSIVSSKVNWKIKSFLKLNAQDGGDSDVFSVGDLKWRIKIFPKGEGAVYDHLSIFLRPVDLKKSVDTEYSLAVNSQTDPNNTVKIKGKYKFTDEVTGRGLKKFMLLSDFHDPVKGYLVNDSCVITVEVTCTMKEEVSKVDGTSDAVEEIVPDKGSESKRQKIKDEMQQD